MTDDIKARLRKAVDDDDAVAVIILANELRLRIPPQGVHTDIPSAPEPAL